MDYIIVNDELCHHGIKGMKWGVRRFQNKDGSLTDAGKKRLAEGLKKNFDKVRDAEKYQRNVADAANRGLTVDDKKQVLNARSKLIDAEVAEAELAELADEYAIEYFNRELDRNPDKYGTDEAAEQLFLDAYNSYGYERACRENPSLVKAMENKDAYAEAYIKACADASDKLLGEYGNAKLCDLEPISLTIKDSIFNTIASMDFDLSEKKARRRLFG